MIHNDKISKYFKFKVLRSRILIRFWFLVTLSLWCGRNSFLGRWCWCCMHAKSSTSTALTSQIVQWCTAHMVFSSKSFYISPAVSCHNLHNTFGPALKSLVLKSDNHQWSKYYFDRLKIKQWVASLSTQRSLFLFL